ncbi:phage portal protein [Mesorhizobium sp. KR1-2]|uniref:phage portal protein n=1 Tax=Mesorhizobium sp. KR1-2 TaxID=3156609 RepID=UPI0032B3A56E
MQIWPFTRKAPVEQKSLAEPDGELLALFTGITPGAGISAAAALTVPAVAAAVRVISEAAASLHIRVLRTDGGKQEDDQAHPVFKLLRGDVNDWTSGYELIRDLVAEALTRDAGGMAWVNRVNGKPAEIIHYDPAVISVEYADTREPKYRLSNRPVPASDIIHLRGPFSRCALTLAREAIVTAHVMEAHASRLFKNGARPGGVIEFPKGLGDEGLKKMKAAWRAAHEGAENAGKTAILWDGAQFKAMTLNSTDAQFLELRKFQILEIARAFRVPPSMLFELDRATWSNSEQMGFEFLTYTLEPWLQALEATLSRALFAPEERGTYRILFDRDDLTRASLTERATAISSLISARVLNPNEGRAWIDLAPYPGGTEFANPHITVSTRTTGPALPKDGQ